MYSLPIIIQLIFDGMATGLVYVILAAGLVLIISVSRILFIAYGQFYMIGAYVVWYLMNLVNLPFFPALGIGTIITGLLGVLGYSLIFQRVEEGPARFLATIIIAMGMSLALSQGSLLVVGTIHRSIPAVFPGSFEIGDVIINLDKLALIIIGVAVALTLFWIYEKTKLGRSMRAVSFNPEAAALQGINVHAVYMLTMGFGTALAGFAGGVIAPSYGINPGMGNTILLSVLLMTMLGGMNSLPGAVLGGLVVGLILSFGQFYIGGRVQIVLFVIIGVIIYFRPTGLLGRPIDMGV